MLKASAPKTIQNQLTFALYHQDHGMAFRQPSKTPSTPWTDHVDLQRHSSPTPQEAQIITHHHPSNFSWQRKQPTKSCPKHFGNTFLKQPFRSIHIYITWFFSYQLSSSPEAAFTVKSGIASMSPHPPSLSKLFGAPFGIFSSKQNLHFLQHFRCSWEGEFSCTSLKSSFSK